MTIKLTVSNHTFSFNDGSQEIASCITGTCSFSDAFIMYGIIALVDN